MQFTCSNDIVVAIELVERRHCASDWDFINQLTGCILGKAKVIHAQPSTLSYNTPVTTTTLKHLEAFSKNEEIKVFLYFTIQFLLAKKEIIDWFIFIKKFTNFFRSVFLSLPSCLIDLNHSDCSSAGVPQSIYFECWLLLLEKKNSKKSKIFGTF